MRRGARAVCLAAVVAVCLAQGVAVLGSKQTGSNEGYYSSRGEEAPHDETVAEFTARITARGLSLLSGGARAGAEDGLLGNNGMVHEEILTVFREWMDYHGKAYEGDAELMRRRFGAFKENLLYLHGDQGAERSYTVGLNSLADLSLEEFRATRLGTSPGNRGALPGRATTTAAFVPGDLAGLDSVNWVERNAVTPVKNQGRCGSCWSFSTTGSIEGINAIVSGNLTSLSEQELVDCDTLHDHGCQGGLMDFAFEFVMKNGLDTEEDYPYQGFQTQCNEAKENRVVVTIDGFEDVEAGNEEEMIKVVSKQPLSVAIQANHPNFQLYTGGVFADPDCGEQLDHGVLVVGYGTSEDGQDYWIMKNSWGGMWGEEGYMKMAMGVAPSGICGIAKMSSYPKKESVDPPAPPPTPPSPGPPPPAPEVVCNQYQKCKAPATCCCMYELFQQCVAYSCCPAADAVCCDDKKSCCPQGTTCNTSAGTCEKGETSIPMLAKEPAILTFAA
ncbi:papain cysteine protease [Chloropicon primus]|uniref:Papain cysteine protease n=1 Tax=Chloropicon primus TaxID=1764295 RepID=A0A5B8MJA9_9CHLO|nr:papain cysteine protease [Chloropicon primus]UPQ98641.1 papain cysteine protease [Chloropicon primus]|eukprot:QDZ19432.1 papain cysteine protease [Chloropicon primus]